jgi:hypothetical protein
MGENVQVLQDSKSSLYEAALAAVQDQDEKNAEEARSRAAATGRGIRIGVLALIGAAGLTVLLLNPEWLSGPKALPPEPPAIATASLRLSLLRERQRVVDYGRQNGRLPESSSDAGITLTGISYARQGPDGFALSAQAGDSVIVLRSSDSMSTFLGSSLLTLRDRGKQ